MLDLIIRRRGKPLAGLSLDAVDLGLELCDFLKHLRRQRCSSLLGSQPIATQHGNDDDSSEHGLSDQGATLHFGPIVAQMISRDVNIGIFGVKIKATIESSNSKSEPGRDAAELGILVERKNRYLRSR